MKSISLCETSHVDQNGGKMDAEKSVADGGRGDVIKPLRLEDNGDGWEENSVIPSNDTEIVQNGDVDTTTVKKEPDISEESTDVQNGTPEEAETIKMELDSDESKPSEFVNIKSDDKSEVKSEIKTENKDLVKDEVKTDLDNLENDVENDSTKDSTQLLISEVTGADGTNGEVTEEEERLEEATEGLEEATEGLEEATNEVEEPTTEGDEERLDELTIETNEDELIDKEGNKENEKLDSDKVFTIEDEDTIDEVIEIERGNEDSLDNNFQVTGCESVLEQDENSWNSTQNSEAAKEANSNKGTTAEENSNSVETEPVVENMDVDNNESRKRSLVSEEEEAGNSNSVTKRRKTDEGDEDSVGSSKQDAYVNGNDDVVSDNVSNSSSLIESAEVQGHKRHKPVDSSEESNEDDSTAKKSKSSENDKPDENDVRPLDDESRSRSPFPPKFETALEETIDMVARSGKPSPFLESFRGKLKNLTRSDLEELAVQKLCEAITERSSCGELRRRAQALEQDSERWKEKVQALSKQMREMEMVMKKYMSEVQKQQKERNFQPVMPLKVTRSVGLQVSFYSNAKGPRPNPIAPNNVTPQARGGVKTALPKTLQPNTPPSILLQRKPTTPTTSPRAQTSIISPPKSILQQQKKPIIPKPLLNPLPPSRPNVSQPLVNSNRVQQNQPIAIRTSFNSPSQQAGSKIIDLTDDDDRQTMPKAFNQINTGVRTQTSQVRMVNHIQQSPINQNNRVAYLLPATTAATVTAVQGAQNRQLLIATPTQISPQNRQVVSSMPPLIFKGGNFVPAGPQTATLNANRTVVQKQYRHPAPLPPPPQAQATRPNWKLSPPRPALKISKVQTGIVLSWNMTLGPEYEPIASYQLYAYQEGNSPPTTSLWKKVGDVKALPLPMACTLTQFMTGHKYHFAVRAVDHHSRIGPFSFPGTIVLVK